jgi:hypothetical protein
MVLVVLTAVTLGLVIGILGMVPRWWQHRRAAALARQATSLASSPSSTSDKNINPASHGI